MNLKADIANPTFTGTVAAPTINATTSLQENGVDTDSKFAPLANPTFTGTLSASTINATTALQVGGVDSGTLFQQRAFIMAVIPVGTTGQVVSGITWNGTASTFTVNKTGTGAYVFTWKPSITSSLITVLYKTLTLTTNLRL